MPGVCEAKRISFFWDNMCGNVRCCPSLRVCVDFITIKALNDI